MIFLDDSEIKVGGVTLPGLVKSIEIDDSALMEEQDIQGSSKRPKQAAGYEDAKINIALILDDGPEDTRLKKLETIQNLFKKAGQDVPVVHDIVNEHTAVRRISQVVFKSLSSKEDNKKEQIAVTLEFWAYVPMVIKATKTAEKEAPVSGTLAGLNSDYQNYLSASRGVPPVSPASCDAADIARSAALEKRLNDI